MHILPFTTRPARFTLVELLVVIVIILILAGMLLPVMSQARARAKMTKCSDQMRQFGMAIVSYRDDHDKQMVPWLSNLYPDYGTEPRLYQCPQDPSGGYDGSRPGAGWAENEYNGSVINIFGQTSPDGDKDSYTVLDAKLKDEFFNTDDTSRNRWRLSGNSAIEKCSYLYEFADVECTWASDPPFQGTTWNAVKQQQMTDGWTWDTGANAWQQRSEGAWTGTYFPVVRCFYHWKYVWGKNELVMNTSYDGNIFKSALQWETKIWE